MVKNGVAVALQRGRCPLGAAEAGLCAAGDGARAVRSGRWLRVVVMVDAAAAAEQLEVGDERQEEEVERQRRPEWVEHVDATTGDVFYVHSKTKEVRFENGDADADEPSIEEQRRQERRRQEKKAARAKVRMVRRREARMKDRRFDPSDRQRKPPTPNTLFRQSLQDERVVSKREALREEGGARAEGRSRRMRNTRSLEDLGWKSGTLETLNRSLRVERPIVSKSLEKLSLIEHHNVCQLLFLPRVGALGYCPRSDGSLPLAHTSRYCASQTCRVAVPFCTSHPLLGMWHAAP